MITVSQLKIEAKKAQLAGDLPKFRRLITQLRSLRQAQAPTPALDAEQAYGNLAG